jgi:hypothetical protein
MYNLLTALHAYQTADTPERKRFAQGFGMNQAFLNETKRNRLLFSADGRPTELYNKLLTLQGRTVEIPAIAPKTIAISDVMSFDIDANLSDTSVRGVTQIVMQAGFALTREDYVENQVSADAMLSNKLEEIDEAMSIKLADYYDTFLGTNKSLVWTGDDKVGEPGDYVFDSSILKIARSAQKSNLFAKLQAMAGYNNWRMDYSLIHNPIFVDVLSDMAMYGAANEKNLLQQSLPPMYSDARCEITTGARSTSYLVEPGSFGIVPNYFKSFVDAEKVGESQWGISSSALPLLGHKVMTFHKRKEATSTKSPMSVTDEFAFILSFFLINKYNPDNTTYVGNILKIDCSNN